jgi:hypothetical protein
MTRLRWTGFFACSLALLLAIGGHWVALQSFAWARMLMDYSRTESFATAVRKTFDGDHPCSLCLKIRDGREASEQQQQKAPWAPSGKAPDFFLENRPLQTGDRPLLFAEPTGYRPRLHADFIDTPPTPPPRA